MSLLLVKNGAMGAGVCNSAAMDAKALLEAAKEGDVVAVRRALTLGAPLDPVPAGQDSPLIFAVMFGHPRAAEVLLEAGARVNHVGQYGSTALHAAATRSLELTRLLLARGANPDVRNDSDNSPLDVYLFAAAHGVPAGVLDALLEGGVDLTLRGTRYAAAGRSPLRLACSVLHLPSVERLLKAGLDLNEGDPPGSSIFGETRHVKAGPGLVELLSLLVARGLNPNATDRLFGRSLLGEACRLGAVELVRSLLSLGAEVNPKAGRAPLLIAEESGNDALVDLLLEAGARPVLPALPAAEAHALEVARRSVEAAPRDAIARSAWAHALATAGFRAAAAAEAFAAARLGAPADDALLQAPVHPGWRFVEARVPLEGLAPALSDARFPDARVADDERTVPLVLALGRPCTECDDALTITCSECNGTGTRPGFLDPDDEYPCEPRVPCTRCGQTRFVINGRRQGLGRCAHPRWIEEAKGERFTLERCAACGLPSITTPVFSKLLACGVCARFDCACD